MLAISLFSGQNGGGLDDVHGSDSLLLLSLFYPLPYASDRNAVAQRKGLAGRMIAFDNTQCGLLLKRRRAGSSSFFLR